MSGWPFVGRAAELADVAAALEGVGAGAMLVGPAGVGKTRLATEALVRCRAGGWATEWIASTAASARVPLGAVNHLLSDPGEVELRPGRLFHRVAARLDAKAGAGRLVLGIDDAHQLDDLSAGLIHHLAASGRAGLIVTARSGERLPEPVVALRKAGHLVRLEVTELVDTAVQELLETVLAGQVATTTVRRLAEASGGNALYLSELVASGLEAGRLSSRGGLWRWQGELATDRLVELLEERIAGIRPVDRRTLEHLAFGEPLELRLLAVVSPDADPEDLERRQLVTLDRHGVEPRLRLTHPLYADVLRASVPELAARRIRGRLADALESGSVDDGDALRLAAWRMDSDGEADPALLVKAGYRALEAADHRLAERLARRALLVSDTDEARYVLAAALSGQGRADQAEDLFAGLAAHADADEGARLAVLAAMDQFWFAGRRAEAEQAMQRAAQLVEAGASRPRAIGVMAARTGFLVLTGSTTATLEAARAVLDAPDAEELQLVRTIIPVAFAAATAGRLDDAERAIERGLPLAARHADLQPAGTDMLLTNRSLLHRLGGRLDEAAAQARQGYEASIEGGSIGLAHPLWLMALGQASLAAGAVGDAVRWLREAAMWLREGGHGVFLTWSLANLAQALGVAGAADDATATLREAEEAHDPALKAFACDLELARAWTRAAHGELSQAAAYCLAAAGVALELEQHAYAAVAFGDAARLGAVHEAARGLADLTGRVEGRLVAALTSGVQAAAAGDPVGLEATASELEAMGALLLAAEAWAEKARLHRDRGETMSSRTALVRARALAARCPGARTPALSRLTEVPSLTLREREIVGMAGRGLANRVIAERLHVSVRTVENHLHNSYAKLGVTSRRQLTALLSQIGPSDLNAL